MGSEMCIRDRASAWAVQSARPPAAPSPMSGASTFVPLPPDVDSLRIELLTDLHVLATDGPPGLRIHAATEAQARAFADRLAIVRSAGSCSITPRSDGTLARVTVELLLDRPVALESVLHRGDFTCDAPLTSVTARTSLGAVALTARGAVPGPIDLHAANGSITADLARLNGTLHATCGIGDVALTLTGSGSRGDAHLSAGRGDVTLRLPDPESAALQVVCPMGATALPPGGRPRPEQVQLECRLHAGLGDVRVVETR